MSAEDNIEVILTVYYLYRSTDYTNKKFISLIALFRSSISVISVISQVICRNAVAGGHINNSQALMGWVD